MKSHHSGQEALPLPLVSGSTPSTCTECGERPLSPMWGMCNPCFSALLYR